MKVGILTTHPIQYQVPWFRALAAEAEIDLTVFFAMLPDAAQQGEEFGVEFQWDLPLLEGYDHRVLENVAKSPSMMAFRGCDTPGIAGIVRDENFDAFIVNGWVVKSCLQVLRACNRYGVPCIVRGESNHLRQRAWWKSVLHRILLRRYSALLYIGEGNRQFYLRNGVPGEKMFFAPYCVENERFAKAAAEARTRRDELRRNWGIPADATTFLFCGKLIPKKHPLDLLEALRRIVERGVPRPVHFLIVGAGEQMDDCRRFVDAHQLPVTFAGFLNQGEISQGYAASDCLVLPSDTGETWGLVVNEAMASGLPAIVSDAVGCQPDLIREGETGATFPVGDAEALADRIIELATSPARLVTMGRAAREQVAAYSYDEVVRGTIAALRSVSDAIR